MRLVWKLTVLVAITAGTQYTLNQWMPELDELWFAVHVYAAQFCGRSVADTHMMDLAIELRDRQYQRIVRHVVAAQATTRPVGHSSDAAIAAELESSLASSG